MKQGDIIIYQGHVCIVSSIHKSGNPNLHVFGVQGEPDARWTDCPPEKGPTIATTATVQKTATVTPPAA